MDRRLVTAVGASLLLLAATIPMGTIARTPGVDAPAQLHPTPRQMSGDTVITKLDRSLVDASGPIQAVVRLATDPVATVKGNAAQKARGAKVTAEQNRVLAKLRGLDHATKLLGRAKIALNALLVEADAAHLRTLAADPQVAAIDRVRDYQIDLDETVPYIGGTAVHEAGFTGAGMVVAVLDTGIDYTHAEFGGPGTTLAYKNAYGVKTKDKKNQKINDAYKGTKLFPTDKVIGGYDFVGEAWTGGSPTPPLAQDPDPIDCSPALIGCDGGHGTHVADIIAGAKGVAPDAKILAYKVCSSLTTACSGVAMIEGIDAALDPNGDGLTNDHADVLNMSIGSQYGQSDDDSISRMVEVATQAGVLVVASAGNSGDKPYATGTPAAAPSALSVAETAVPSALSFAMLVSTDGGATSAPREAVHQSWSHDLDFALTNVPVQFGDGSGGNLLGCDPFAAGSLDGKIVLVDRGSCTFSLKISNIAAGGGAIGLIGLVAPGDPFNGGLGDCPDDLCAQIPGFMISQADATALKGASARVTFDPANGISLKMHMIGESSRGPDNDHNLIKPEIGAPGASVSAVVGSGTGSEPFGGTSGAAPMVTGSAALLRQAYPGRSPLEIKAVLIDTGETEIMNRPAVFGGDKAPITRIGGGEVRVDRALETQVAAWDDNAPSAALSFGFQDITSGGSVTRTVRVRNYGGTAVTYDLNSTFRFANDASNGAVSVTPSVSSLTVPAYSDRTFDLTIEIDGSKLRTWTLDSGINGASAAALQSLEYDGYLWLDAAGTANDIHLPWQVLPRKDGDVSASSTDVSAGDTVTLTNTGVGRAWIGSFSLIATSPKEAPTGLGDDLADVDLRYVGVRQFTNATYDLGCDSPVAIQFAVNTWERQVHADGPALFEFDLDIDQDGTADYAVYNLDLGGSGLSDGRNFVFALDLATGDQTSYWPTVHPTNSANTVLTVCGEQIGLDASSIGSTIDVMALAVDWYNSGAVTDFVATSIVVGGDRYTTDMGPAQPDAAVFGGTIGGGSSADVTIIDHGPTGTNPTETGVLLTTDETLLGQLGFGQSGGAPQASEAIAITVDGGP